MLTIVPHAWVVEAGVLFATLMGVGMLAWAGGLRLGARRGLLHGTTLVAPCRWAMFALAAVGAAELAVARSAANSSALWVQAVRYGAAVSTLCPAIALLGAKRPQNRAWQFIVLACWIVLQMPSLHWLLVRPDAQLYIFAPWSWFVTLLIIMQLAGFLATRFWPSLLLTVVAQMLLFSPYWPVSSPEPTMGTYLSTQHLPPSAESLAALLLVTFALVLVFAGIPRRRRTLLPHDRLWLDFRDAFGTVWALRVASRWNQFAVEHQGSAVLSWQGFLAAGDPDNHPQKPDAQTWTMFCKLLQRFVDRAWIAQRMDEHAG